MHPSNKCAEVIKDRLYWLSDTQPPSRKGIVHFNTDQSLYYTAYCMDFGPLSIGMVFKYCKQLSQLLGKADHKSSLICHYTSTQSAKRVNSALLICCFQVLCLNISAIDAISIFQKIQPPFQPFRDALKGPCSYHCTIRDVVCGLEYACKIGWFSMSGFSLKDYQFYQKVQQGDLNWIIPKKMIAFSSPSSESTDGDGNRLFTVDDYVPIFKSLGVSLVVRLNNKTYDASNFVKAGINHLDLYFQDGTCPSRQIIKKFLSAVETTDGAVAVHCKAGLGRTGTLIGCYAMKHYRFDPGFFIGYIRLCRPGSILGPQQHFLHQVKDWLYSQSEESPIYAKLKSSIEQSKDMQEVIIKVRSLSMKKEPVHQPNRFDKQIQLFGDKGQGARLVSCKMKKSKPG